MSRKSVQEIWDEQDEEMLYLWARNIQLEAINEFIMGPGLPSLMRSLHAYTMTMGISPRLIGVFDALREPEKYKEALRIWNGPERRQRRWELRMQRETGKRLQALAKAGRNLPRNLFDQMNDTGSKGQR